MESTIRAAAEAPKAPKPGGLSGAAASSERRAAQLAEGVERGRAYAAMKFAE